MLVEGIDLLYRVAYKGYLTHGESKVDREIAHHRMVRLMRTVNRFLPENFGQLLDYQSPVLEYRHRGARYPNRTGIAAGLDKTGELAELFSQSGAAAGMSGGVTREGDDGAPKIRVTADRNGLGFMNWMKFPNPGQEIVAENLKKGKKRIDREKFKVGVNTAISQKSIQDKSVTGDFKEVNRFFLNQDIDVLEANFGHFATAGYQAAVGNREVFEAIVADMVQANHWEIDTPKITSVKLSMDSPIEVLVEQTKTAIRLGVDQVNIGNTTRHPEILSQLDLYTPDQGGGYCGPLSLEVVLPKVKILGEICSDKGATLTLSAGVGSFRAAVRAHITGADLIQSLHGLILPNTGGPGFFYRINKNVAEFCQSIQIDNVSQLRGKYWVLDYLDDYKK